MSDAESTFAARETAAAVGVKEERVLKMAKNVMIFIGGLAAIYAIASPLMTLNSGISETKVKIAETNVKIQELSSETKASMAELSSETKASMVELRHNLSDLDKNINSKVDKQTSNLILSVIDVPLLIAAAPMLFPAMRNPLSVAAVAAANQLINGHSRYSWETIAYQTQNVETMPGVSVFSKGAMRIKSGQHQ